MSAASGQTGTRAVLRREWSRLRQDPWDAAMLSLIPLLVYGLLWWMFSAGLARDVPIAVVDLDHSAVSRQLGRWLEAAPGLAVAEHPADEAAALESLRGGRIGGFVLVPRGLEQALRLGRSASVHWVYDAQSIAQAGLLGRDVRGTVATLSAGLELGGRERRGAQPVAARAQLEPLTLRLATLFNETSNQEGFLTLTAIPSLMQIFFVLSVITGVGRELKAGSVPQWLACAGGRWRHALAGKLAWPALAALLQCGLFVAFFAGLRGWAVQGSGWALAAALLGLVAASFGLGLLLIGALLSLRTALSAAAFITAPAFAFSGQGYPLLAMPPVARFWGDCLPLTHYLQLQSRHWLEGAPAPFGVQPLLHLLGFALVTLCLGAWLMRWRAEQPTAWGRV
ncbi:MAG TPA: ABC transporter permease [Burkholderiaceae bacterium]|nr:ABC transporter permease [Burkholderiaceae bacterium]HMX09285.1 ABC transporter permease [Burkholderiaceae bacterium]HMY98071.1 ABC transporter permease [Burkholderiaceae bacterium]HNG78473.1 ABC transporter permease [Burkholderiaceae bacterium]